MDWLVTHPRTKLVISTGMKLFLSPRSTWMDEVQFVDEIVPWPATLLVQVTVISSQAEVTRHTLKLPAAPTLLRKSTKVALSMSVASVPVGRVVRSYLNRAFWGVELT